MRRRSIRVLLGTPLIYLPILTTIPFVFIGSCLVRLHLRALGAKGVLRYRDFIPEWLSHRYTHRDQIVATRRIYALAHYKFFWIFNCKIYCPLSVALFRYVVYLVKIVENWWCPFAHDKKADYSDAKIDGSYWHVTPERQSLLHPDDASNPTWNN